MASRRPSSGWAWSYLSFVSGTEQAIRAPAPIATRGQTDMRGSGWPQDRVSSWGPPSRNERRPALCAGVLIDHPRISRVGRSPDRLLGRGHHRRSSVLQGRDRPAEAGKLARHGDRDERRALAPRPQACPGAVKAPLRRPAHCHRRGRLAGLPSGERLADVGTMAVVPGPSTRSRRAWREPVLVIEPRRRCSPVVDSEGTSPT